MAEVEEIDTDFIFDRKKMLVKDFETQDNEIVSFFKDYEDRPQEIKEKFENTLKVGVVAVKTIGVAEKIDYVQKEFNELDNKFKDTFTTVTEELDEKLEGMFGEEGTFSDVLEEHFGENGKIVKELFDPNREGTPLYNLKMEIEKKLEVIKEKLGIKEIKEEIISKTPLKGFDFENYCESILSKIARIYGDVLEKTGTKAGKVKLSKKGDFVLTLGHSERRKSIVVELKDGGRYSLNEIQRTMEEAINNREAMYGIFIVKNTESLPESVGWFNEYNGNQLVCALGNKESNGILHEEILYIAYKWAKLKIVLESLKEKKFDASFVNEKVSTIKNKLEEFKAIRTQCSNIETASEEIRTISRRAEKSMNEQLSQILESLRTDS
jgi:hypothetical protein